MAKPQRNAGLTEGSCEVPGAFSSDLHCCSVDAVMPCVPAEERIRYLPRNRLEPVGVICCHHFTIPVHLRFPEGSLSLGKP